MQKQVRDIKGILIDFDGIISNNSIDITLEFTYDYINKYTPIHFETLKTFYRSVNALNLQNGLELLFKSFGLEEKVTDFLKQLKNLSSYKDKKISIEPDFFPFIESCNKNKINYSLYSLADKEKINTLLGIELNYIPVNSKVNLNELNLIKKKLNINKQNKWLLFDDDPFILRYGKLANLQTVWKENDFFQGKYYLIYEKFIDFKVNSFTELQSLFFC